MSVCKHAGGVCLSTHTYTASVTNPAKTWLSNITDMFLCWIQYANMFPSCWNPPLASGSLRILHPFCVTQVSRLSGWQCVVWDRISLSHEPLLPTVGNLLLHIPSCVRCDSVAAAIIISLQKEIGQTFTFPPCRAPSDH